MGYNTELKKENEVRQFLAHRGFDVELISNFLEEHLALQRETDTLCKNNLGKTEYYERELTYTHVEKFLLSIK